MKCLLRGFESSTRWVLQILNSGSTGRLAGDDDNEEAGRIASDDHGRDGDAYGLPTTMPMRGRKYKTKQV